MKTERVMIGLLAGLYWFDEALQKGLAQRGWGPVPRAHSLVFMNLAIGETRPSRIARNLGVTRQAISHLIGQMHASGLVVVRPDPTDQRALIVDFSPQTSTGLRQAVLAILLELEETLGERIGHGRMAALREALALDWGDPPDLREAAPAPKPATARSETRRAGRR